MHELDCDCGFADRGCHSLDRSMTGVTGYEDPGLARLEWVGITLKRPPAISVTTGQDVGAGDHESVLVATEPSFDPLGHGNAADHDEQRICGQLDLLTRRLVGDHESFQSPEVVEKLRKLRQQVDSGVVPDDRLTVQAFLDR